VRSGATVVGQVRHMWKVYMWGLLGAMAFALCVAAIGGLFGQVEVREPSPIREYKDFGRVGDVAEWLVAVMALIGAGVALLKFGLYGFWHNLMTRFRRYGSPD